MKKAFSSLLLALGLGSIVVGNALAQPITGLPCKAPAGLDLSQRDVARLDGLVGSRTLGLASALEEADAGTRAAVAGLYSGGLAAPADLQPGNYQCRTIKLGGLLPAIVYGFFDCRISQMPDGFGIEKTSGSQRFSGTLTQSGPGLAYRGALHYGDEAPIDYAGDSDRDQVGCLVAAGSDAGRYLLELPAPAFESLHDVIELVPEP